eukprot:7491201-Pyramimonas_sp.AAC.1
MPLLSAFSRQANSPQCLSRKSFSPPGAKSLLNVSNARSSRHRNSPREIRDGPNSPPPLPARKQARSHAKARPTGSRENSDAPRAK